MDGLFDFFRNLFDTTGFTPRNAGAGGSTDVLWLNVGSDLLLWLVYMTIAILLLTALRRRHDVKFTPVVWLVGATLVLLGVTHFLDFFAYSTPFYRFTGLFKLMTTVVSWTTVAVAAPLLPRLFALRNPQEVRQERTARQEAEVRLREVQTTLNQRIEEKTTEIARLNETNAKLQSEIEERKRVEAEWQYSVRTLEEARERVAQQVLLLQQQVIGMVSAREEALASARTKSASLDNMSQEVHSSMQSVLNTADKLEESSLSAIQNDYVYSIRNTAETLLVLVRNILDFGKMEGGKQTLDVTDFSLRQVMEDITARYTPHAQKKGLLLNCEIPSDLPTELRGDPVRLSRVLANLTGNAIKFTESGAVTLQARLLKETENEVSLCLLVTDTGQGIPHERHSSLFTGFSHAENKTDERRSVGLGLTLCRQLTELMGGHIGVESEMGKGSAFFVELTLGRQAVSALADNSEEEAEGERLEQVFAAERLRASCGDDAVFLREVLQEFLSVAPQVRSGLVTAVAANDAEQARVQARALGHSARLLGAEALGQVCQEIETLDSPEPEEAATILELFEREYARLEVALELYLLQQAA